MKTPRTAVITACLLLLLVPAIGAAETTRPTTAARPAGTALAADAPPAVLADAANPWSKLKRYTYDERDLFVAGIKELESRVDAQLSELAAKRAEMNANNTSTEEWDFAVEEMKRARTTLISTSEDMTKATRESWNQQKDQVGLAWVWTQDAYAKVKASTTT